MNPYELRQAIRKSRQAERAEDLSAAADQLFAMARRSIEHIPPGQPILVGHHSERRHRRDLARHDRLMRRAIETRKHADELARVAATTSRAISSDDPDAPDKLRERIAALEDGQRRMAAVNAAWRKAGKPAPNDRDGWQQIAAACALSDEQAQRIRLDMARDPLGRGPFPPYALINNNGNIRRLKARIAEIDARAGAAPRADISGDGFTIREDADDNRLLILFDVIPPTATRARLKAHGFKWSPTRGAWVRQLNGAARIAAGLALGQGRDSMERMARRQTTVR